MRHWHNPTRCKSRGRPLTRVDSRRPASHAVGMDRTKDWDRLADYVMNWRVRKGWERPDLAREMRMGERTVERIENATQVRGSTLAALELALDWEPGDARRILTGLEPLAASKGQGLRYPNDPERQALWDRFRPLTDDDDLVANMVEAVITEQERHSITERERHGRQEGAR